MKKFYLLLFTALISSQFVSAQTATREVINFTELANYEATFGVPAPCRNCEKEKEGGKRLITDRPLPPGAIVKEPQSVINTSPTAPSAPLAASLPPTQTFLGHVDPGQTIPPDSHGAVGINHVVTATNDFVKIHNKLGGSQVSQVSISTFTGIANTCDPYIVFDERTQRFYMSTIECTSNGNRVILQISNTSNPTGTWTRYTWVPASTDGSLLLDHPYLGFDNRWIVVSGRKFPSGFTGPILFVFDKANLLAGGTVTFGTNAQLLEKTSADGDSPLPVMNQDASAANPASAFYVLQAWNGTSIRLSTVTGNIPTATWNTGAAVFPSNSASPWQNNPTGATNSNLAQQLGETRRLSVNDARISCGVLKNGAIWCSQHVFLPATGNVDRAAVQWWKLTTAGAVSEVGKVGGATAGEYRWFSSIAVDNFDNALIGYTYSTTAIRVGAAYVTKRGGVGGSGTNLTDDDFIYKAGVSTYWKDFSGGAGRARWGDYSHTALDPVDGSLWTIQEYAEQRTATPGTDNDSRYGVYWAQVTMPNALQARDAALAGIIDPVGGGNYCNFPITPRVTVRNNGSDTLKSVQIAYRVDGGTPTALQTFTMNLPTFGTQNFTLSAVITGPLTAGNHTFQAWTFNPNGLADQRTNNDTNTISFNVQQSLTLPSLNNFEPLAAGLPLAAGWAVLNPDGAITISKRTSQVTGPTGALTSVIWEDMYNYGARGQVDMYRTPKIDIAAFDTVTVEFDMAYKGFDNTYHDSLEVVYSDDCGVTWKPTGFKVWDGTMFTATPNYTTAAYVPASAAEWKHQTIKLPTCAIPSSSIMVALKVMNDFGNNLYIDNFNITGASAFARNIAVNAVTSPANTVCTGSFTPAISFTNLGTSTLTSATFTYVLNSVPAGTTQTGSVNWTGSLPRCSTAVFSLSSLTASPGSYNLTITSSNPNGGTDLYTPNDAATKLFTISPSLNTPLFEGFEGNFVPTGWGVQNPDGLTTWAKSTAGARSGGGSMWINNPAASNAASATDMFFSPVVLNNASIDSMYVDWDYAYKPGPQYPGATVFPLDTLEVRITRDCGATFTTVWKKWGNELQSLEDPNYAYVPSFTPTNAGEWKHVRVYLTPFVGSSNYQVYFVAKSNKQNNIWIDNINITSRTVPIKVKNQGYGIYPNPFNNTFRIHHWIAPADLQAAQVFNSFGELVWDKRFAGNASTEEFVDMRKFANGVYVLKMTYSNKTIIERIVKQ